MLTFLIETNKKREKEREREKKQITIKKKQKKINRYALHLRKEKLKQ